MTNVADECHLTVRNELSELERVGRAIEDFARDRGVAADDISAISLAVDEIVSNAIAYAYPAGERREVEIRARADGGVFTVVIEDSGRPFDPTGAPEPALDAPLDDRPVGGLGIHIARRLVDEMTYRRRADRNVVTLTKRFTPGAAAGVADADQVSAPIDETEADGVVVFAVGGRLGAGAAALLEQRLRARLAEGTRRFVFDCARLASIASAGVRVLLIAARESAARGGGVGLATPGPAIARTIDVAGLSTLLPSYASRAEALEAFGRKRSSP